MLVWQERIAGQKPKRLDLFEEQSITNLICSFTGQKYEKFILLLVFLAYMRLLSCSVCV